MITMERIRDYRGTLYAGYFVKNKAGRNVAIGAVPMPDQGTPGFLMMTYPRYQHDQDLVAAVSRLTGQKVELRHKVR